MHTEMTVNGVIHAREIEPRRLLVDFLRKDLGLTGTHVGCDTTQCGACTVLVDGEAIKSCTMLAAQADGCSIQTIEGLGGDEVHPMQEAFSCNHALQCGFCTPGMIMLGVDIMRRLPDASETEIRHQLEGNFCRCTGYQNIVKAIHSLTGGKAA